VRISFLNLYHEHLDHEQLAQVLDHDHEHMDQHHDHQ